MDKDIKKIIDESKYTPWYKLITYKVKLIDKIPETEIYGRLIKIETTTGGITNHKKRLISVWTKDKNGNPIDEKDLEATLYHETKHADFLPMELGFAIITSLAVYQSVLEYFDNSNPGWLITSIISVGIGITSATISTEAYAYCSQFKKYPKTFPDWIKKE